MLALFIYEAVIFIVVAAVLAITAMPVVKWQIPALSWMQSLRISWSATFIAFGSYWALLAAIVAVSVLTKNVVHRELVGELAIPTLLGSAWLISMGAKKAGYSQKFPGIGTKVFVSWIGLSWIVVGVIYLVSKF